MTESSVRRVIRAIWSKLENMEILTIDTTGAAASVSIINEKGETAAELSDDMMSHLQLLMPMISRVTERAGIKKTQITHVAVTVGPGSFTGIRIGMATAKTLAQVWNVPMIALSSLEVFSAAVGESGDLICPMIDAKHGQIFGGIFRNTRAPEEGTERAAAQGVEKENRTGMAEILLPEGVYDAEEFIGKASELALGDSRAERLLFCGNGAERHRALIRGETARIVPDNGKTHELYAAAAAETALSLARLGRLTSYEEIRPVYLRKSEAERKLAAKELGKKKKAQKREEPVIFELPPEDEEISYRRAGIEDAAGMAELDALCFSHPWSETAFLGEFQAAAGSFYVIAENGEGKPVGFAGISGVLDEGEVHRMAVHPLYRGRGIAGTMMEHILAEAETRGIRTQLLEVRESNRTAIALYKNQGFRVTGRRDGYYADSGENALLMRRESGLKDDSAEQE